jgi:hypothetical protein
MIALIDHMVNKDLGIVVRDGYLPGCMARACVRIVEASECVPPPLEGRANCVRCHASNTLERAALFVTTASGYVA